MDRIDLIRYGKFTDRSIAFPNSEKDFHLIVGKNEAGKSTFREAILDLLYGFPKISPYAFLHPYTDLRLGGLLEHGVQSSVFIRTKGNKNTLLNQSEKVLPDSALVPFLGATDREFFSQMFGLSHERLVSGGASILSASNDLGQILFQAAAGVGNLTRVRDDLESQSDKLWSKRKAKDRSYYIASEEFDAATTNLRLNTVRTRDWVEAKEKLDNLESEEKKSKLSHDAIKQKRRVLERIRRVLPNLRILDDAAKELELLGEVRALPDLASAILAKSSQDEFLAKTSMDSHSRLEAKALEILRDIKVDHNLLGYASEIAELNEYRLKCLSFDGDIKHCQAEIGSLRAMLQGLVRQLGWDSDEAEAIETRLPSLPIRASLSKLIRDYEALQVAFDAAEQSRLSKCEEIAQTDSEITKLPSIEEPVGLRVALSQAKLLGDFHTIKQSLQKTVNTTLLAQDAAQKELKPFPMDLAVLQTMIIPSVDLLTRFTQEDISDHADKKLIAKQVTGINDQIRDLRLEIDQYLGVYKPIFQEEVLKARESREQAWEKIKELPDQLPRMAFDYEVLVEAADSLADYRHEKVQYESELKSKEQRLERLNLELTTETSHLDSLQDSMTQRQSEWEYLAAKCGLPDISFLIAGKWVEARQRVLDASFSAQQAQSSLSTHLEACENARKILVKELQKQGEHLDAEPLEELILRADSIIANTTIARTQSIALSKQLMDANKALVILARTASQSEGKLNKWRKNWSEALLSATILTTDDVGAVEGYLGIMDRIHTALEKIRIIQTEQINRMTGDMTLLAEKAHRVAKQVAPDLIDRPANEIVIELGSRLVSAKDAQAEKQRQDAILKEERAEIKKAKSSMGEAQSLVSPLLALAGVTTKTQLTDAILKSDLHRDLIKSIKVTKDAILDGGDGLSLEELREEITLIKTKDLLTELEELTNQDDELIIHRTGLSAEIRDAKNLLDSFGGSAGAAKAEGQRQEALSLMASAIERYLKVYTASRLLKWAIEQYREAKQGPMLETASKWFAHMTMGSFERLSVDFDSEPPQLLGRRPNGGLLPISAMSEGTRDQLYFALRMAALGMHLEQAHVLPFIADDLFFKFDDERSAAGLEVLRELSTKTQVIFLTHHPHLVPIVQNVFGDEVNLVRL